MPEKPSTPPADTSGSDVASVRIEHDLLGDIPVPAASLHGAHTERALENFPLAGRPVHVELARAFGVGVEDVFRYDEAVAKPTMNKVTRDGLD